MEQQKNPEEKEKMDSQGGVSVKKWYAQGWQTYKKNPRILILGSLVVSGLSALFTLLNVLSGGQWIIVLSQFFITPVLGIGWLYLCLLSVRDENPGFAVVFSAFKRYGRVWVTCILFILLIVAGLFLVIVPGVLWALKYGLSLFTVMDTDRYARNAFRYSKRITKGFLGKLFGFFIISALLSSVSAPFSMGIQKIGTGDAAPLLLIGLLPFLAAMVLISPWIGTSFASAYESLKGAEQHAPQREPEEKKSDEEGA
jgi:hypothetical protein